MRTLNFDETQQINGGWLRAVVIGLTVRYVGNVIDAVASSATNGSSTGDGSDGNTGGGAGSGNPNGYGA